MTFVCWPFILSHMTTDHIAEAQAIARKLWPVETSQCGGHLARELALVAFGHAITPRTIARRWYATRNMEAIAPIVELAPALASVPDPQPVALVEPTAKPRVMHKPRTMDAKRTSEPRYVVTYAPNATADQRLMFDRKLASIKPTKRYTPIAYKATIEADGLARLTYMRVPKPSDRVIVRIHYTTMGGEIVYCDTDPMGTQAANTMVHEIAMGGVCAASARVYSASNRPKCTDRLVVFPSQMTMCPTSYASEKTA